MVHGARAMPIDHRATLFGLVDSTRRGQLGHPLSVLSRPLSTLLSRCYEPGDQASDVNHLKAPADHESLGRRIECATSDGNEGAQQVRPRGDKEKDRPDDQPSQESAAASSGPSAAPGCTSRKWANTDPDSPSRDATPDAESAATNPQSHGATVPPRPRW